MAKKMKVTRVLPGFKRKQTHLDITDDKMGHTVKFSPANYIRSHKVDWKKENAETKRFNEEHDRDPN